MVWFFFILLQVQSSRRIKKTVLRNWHSSMPFIRSTRIKLCWRTPRWSTIFNTSLRTILSEHRRKVCFRYIFHDLSPKNCINILYSKYYAFTFKDYGKRNIISSIFFQFNNFSIFYFSNFSISKLFFYLKKKENIIKSGMLILLINI